MQTSNFSTIILLGFQNMDNYKVMFFSLLIAVYCVTLGGNLLIITLVFCSKNLQSPMYFFLTQLSISDIMLTSDIVPNMLRVVLNNGAAISLTGCIIQFFFFSLSETSECFLLTVMSYDRYLAICRPLHYNYIMTQMLCLKSIIISWILSFFLSLIITMAISKLKFGGPNIIDNFFCDLYPILKLSCSDIYIVQMIIYLLSPLDTVFPLILIIISYTYIVIVISKMSTLSGRWRSFSTCSSHLTVVAIFYGTLITMYVIPNKGQLQVIGKILSFLYTVITPFINPFIYSLRNKDIKEALLKVVNNYRVYFLNKSKIKVR